MDDDETAVYEHPVRLALRTAWELHPATLEPIGGGHPLSWSVTCGERRYTATIVPVADRAQFEAGLSAAEHLRDHGVAVSAPVRTLDGALTVCGDTRVLAVTRWLPGRPLDGGDPLDQQWWGDALGKAHQGLDGFAHPGVARWHWIRADATHLGIEGWLRPAVAAAVSALTRLTVTDQLTYGVLHGDPMPQAFMLDVATGRTGVGGWGLVATGPLVYDVAAAVAYAGSAPAAGDLLDAYAAAGPVSRDEIDAALPVLLRFRRAVQADRCARRIAAGSTAPLDVDGLRAARDRLC